MRCLQCSGENAEGAAFCTHCGSRIQAACPSCGGDSAPGSRYCGRCGAPIDPESSAMPEAVGDGHPPAGAQTGCPRCHTINEPGSRYCFRCGLPLEGAAPADQGLVAADGSYLGTPAGFWIRLAAYVVDSVLLGVVGTVVAMVLFGQGALEGGGFTRTNFLGVCLEAVYYMVAVAEWQTTIGKRLFGLYVIRADGSRIGAGRALARYLLYALSAILLFAGFVMIGLRDDKRGLHDLICDTRVVRR